MFAAVAAAVERLARASGNGAADADARDAADEAAGVVAVAVLEELERAAGRGLAAEAEAVVSVPRAFDEAAKAVAAAPSSSPSPAQALLDALLLDLLWPLASHAVHAAAAVESPSSPSAAQAPTAPAVTAVAGVARRCALEGSRPREAFVAIAEAVSRLAAGAATGETESQRAAASADLAGQLAQLLPPLMARLPPSPRRTAAFAGDACAALAEAARAWARLQQPGSDESSPWWQTHAAAAQQLVVLLAPSETTATTPDAQPLLVKAHRRAALLCLQLLSLLPPGCVGDNANTGPARTLSLALVAASGSDSWTGVADLVLPPAPPPREQDGGGSDDDSGDDDEDEDARPLLPPGSLMGAARALLLSCRSGAGEWPLPPPSLPAPGALLDPACRVAAALFRAALSAAADVDDEEEEEEPGVEEEEEEQGEEDGELPKLVPPPPPRPPRRAAAERMLDASLELMASAAALSERLWRMEGAGASQVGQQQLPRTIADAASLAALAAAQAPAAPTRARAADALRALLSRALPPGKGRAALLRALLDGQPPEVCALVLQTARLEMVAEMDGFGQGAGAGAGGSGNGPPGGDLLFLSLAPLWALEWVVPSGDSGWHPPSVARLVAHANACCAALNVLRLLLLRPGAWARAAGAAAAAAEQATSSPSPPPPSLCLELLRDRPRLVREALDPLAVAVRAALAELEEERRGEEAEAAAGAAAEAGDGASAAAAAAVAGGGGGATDAALALDRVQVVLEHVLQLLVGGGGA